MLTATVQSLKIWLFGPFATWMPCNDEWVISRPTLSFYHLSWDSLYFVIKGRMIIPTFKCWKISILIPFEIMRNYTLNIIIFSQFHLWPKVVVLQVFVKEIYKNQHPTAFGYHDMEIRICGHISLQPITFLWAVYSYCPWTWSSENAGIIGN